MIPHISIINMKWVPLKFNSSKFNFIIPFSNSPTHKWKLIEDPTRTPLDLVREFNGQNLYRIGKCYPLNLLLWKYVYFTGWPINTISLNCSIICVNDDIPHTSISHDMINPHYYVYFDIYLVLREFLRIAPSTIPFEVASLLYYIRVFLFKSNSYYSTQILDV